MRRFILPIAMLSAVMLIAVSASAAQTKPHLSFLKTGATIGWSTAGGSSPADSPNNNQSLRISVSSPSPPNGASAYTYGVDETLVGIRGKALDAITHLGFDSKGYLGAGAPRISLGTITVCGGTGQPICRTGEPNGTQHTFFLSAYYCNDVTSGGWRTSDFTNTVASPSSSGGALGGCDIFESGVALGPLGLDSAAAAFPNDVVISSPNDWFLIVDESPSLTYVDRLSVQEWMWTRSGDQGILNCNSGPPFCI